LVHPANSSAPKRHEKRFSMQRNGSLPRDGFEAARLEDIAARAGRSRGAFYANYRDKEELFFALRERALHVYGLI
jgi:AcrR family transcriptional regulator